jgi:hypothetical protein
MITYNDIAEAYIEDRDTRERFCQYFHCRYHDLEKNKCLSGYAKIWAELFNKGIEKSAMDPKGLVLMRDIDLFRANIEKAPDEDKALKGWRELK